MPIKPGGARRVVMTEGDTSPSLVVTFYDGNGAPVDLTLATSVKVYMRNRAGVLKIDGSAAAKVAPATSGKARYEWGANDLATRGVYRLRFVAEFPGGTVISFPNDTSIEVEVRAPET